VSFGDIGVIAWYVRWRVERHDHGMSLVMVIAETLRYSAGEIASAAMTYEQVID
jgi:hypothetical protein